MDAIVFNNTISYMVVRADGSIGEQGSMKNRQAPRVRDAIARALTTPGLTGVGTILQVTHLGFRPDGTAVLGSWNEWVTGGSAYSTRYSNSTYVTSVMFNGTFTATANVTVKTVALYNNTPTPVTTMEVASFCHFYSTSFNVTLGSGGQLIVQWTVNVN